jgi:hypothetical protein
MPFVLKWRGHVCPAGRSVFGSTVDPKMPGGEFPTLAAAEAATVERETYFLYTKAHDYEIEEVPGPTKPAFPTDRQERKEMPVARGVIDYFPLALLEVAKVSYKANQQHNPGEPMHWARGKSTDHADCIARHLMERGTLDKDDGLRHSAKLAWRALALLQTELELAQGYDAEAASK